MAGSVRNHLDRNLADAFEKPVLRVRHRRVPSVRRRIRSSCFARSRWYPIFPVRQRSRRGACRCRTVNDTATSEGGDHVDRRPVLFEDFKYFPQESIGHQHAGGVDADDGDAVLGRYGVERLRVVVGSWRSWFPERGGPSYFSAVPEYIYPYRAVWLPGAESWHRSRPIRPLRRSSCCGSDRCASTKRGSLLCMPSMSVQICTSEAPIAAPISAAL